MVRIIYRLKDGSAQTIDASPGENVMQVAADNGIDGIIGRCGGYGSCGTCHVYVDEQWAAALPEPSFEEDEMLAGAPAKRLPTSRLGCQVRLTEALDGIAVTIPECQE